VLAVFTEFTDPEKPKIHAVSAKNMPLKGLIDIPPSKKESLKSKLPYGNRI
jgi:hypothetical protein